MGVKQLPRALRAFRAVLADRLFLNLPVAHREAAACDLDDASLVQWVRWSLATSAKFYKKDAEERGRDLAEMVTQHGVIALALLVLKANATRGTFDVRGITYRDQEVGDWRVTIERIGSPTHD